MWYSWRPVTAWLFPKSLDRVAPIGVHEGQDDRDELADNSGVQIEVLEAAGFGHGRNQTLEPGNRSGHLSELIHPKFVLGQLEQKPGSAFRLLLGHSQLLDQRLQ